MPTTNDETEGLYLSPYVYTSSGKQFFLREPKFDLNDMAHSLCNISRFNGHITYSYSVGQHSMLVADIVELMTQQTPAALRAVLVREALLHDGTEAYLSDVPAPFKRDLPDWQAIDARLEAALRRDFGLPAEKSEVVKLADWYALFIEATALMPEGVAEKFEDPLNVREAALQMAEDNDLWRGHIGPSDLYADRELFKKLVNLTYTYYDTRKASNE